MIPEKLKQIMILLLNKTMEKKAIWNKTSGNEEYKLVIGDGSSVVITEYFGNYNSEYYQISVYNNRGEVVERYNNEEEENPTDNKLIVGFHKAARDSYFKVDETMDNLLAEISKQDFIGESISSPEEDDDDNLPF